ncbi:LysR family transcriptional regulator [Aliivibrio fischeri]|uniref:LysR family transcriptional regulator n=1 Tax=Aliivibrio fischeri TaxID=668 RepID=UPI001F196863|nr:LysR family transcriptional regulator [Aliivibrio fischeri]MCE4934608.1 LysR family transcriptional regulator [Aliivibrio fischeri]
MHTLEQVSAFVAVYEHGSYSSAARELKKSRTTVREHVVTYEDLLGYSLFVIEGRKAIPTEKAEQLYHRAKLVEKQNRSLFVQSQALYGSNVHTITIYYDVITPLSLITHIEKRVMDYNSDIIINWKHRTRQEAMDKLQEGECDIAIMPYRGQLFAEKEVTWKAIKPIQVGCYASVNSPLALIDDLRLENLMLETQYVTENFATLKLNFASIQVSPKMHTVSNNDLLCELVKQHGWTIMPRHYMTPYVERGELIELNLKELGNNLSFGLNAFYCYGKSDAEVFGLILEWIEEWAEALERC